jgi:CubicO group peptidase (beta-lactamase class C family)
MSRKMPRMARSRVKFNFICLLAATLLVLAFASAGNAQKAAQKQAVPAAKAHATNEPRLSELDSVMQAAIEKDEIPGGVILVSHEGRIVWRKAYGSRAIVPTREAMTVDTIFDLASLTKVFATTACVMKLVEQGKLRLNDPAVRYLPELGTTGATA